MGEYGTKYRYQTLKVIRGREASKIAEMERQGWEVDKRTPGRLRTEITFRRDSPVVPWKLVGGLGAFAVVGIAIFGILAALGVDDDDSNEATNKPEAGVSATEQPSPSPSGSPSETESESATPTVEPTPTQAQGPALLTVKNSPDLKKMLEADDDYSLNAAFAKSHNGQKIRFDGSVADATPGYFLVYYGDDSDDSATSGPAFQFRVRSLQVSGGDVAATGDNLRFVATVGRFNADQGLFFLAPINVTPR